tara:strand:- start:134 stop:1570 length:1437 start_codon:yes stop_codon:yes gene_type:complete
MEYLDKELKTTDPKNILYLAFSRAAVRAAKERAPESVRVCTMHSLGSQELKIDTSKNLLQNEKWKGFKNYSKICADLSFETQINDSGFPQYKNSHMKVIEYARNKKLSLQDSAVELDLHFSVDLWLTEQIYQDLITYKDHTGMVEYSDMISKFVEEDKCPPLHAVFLDEAQDLSPLQWDMFFYIEKRAQRSYIAGDDDQTIYTFQGADPSIFINLKGTEDPQIKSRRVPKKIHELAESIFPYMSQRLDKKWKPREAEGEVHTDTDFYELDFSKGTWFVLTRTNKMLQPLKDHLYNLNIRFDAKQHDLLSEDMLTAYRSWVRLNKGASIDTKEAENLYKFFTVKGGQVARGFASGKTLQGLNSVTLEELRAEHGLLVTGDWELLNFPDASKEYIRTILKSEDLMKDARIKLSTIHGVKGEEAENVVLFTDLERIIYDSALKDSDPEHRTFFVGITRAKEKIFITNQGYEYQYNIGVPII